MWCLKASFGEGNYILTRNYNGFVILFKPILMKINVLTLEFKSEKEYIVRYGADAIHRGGGKLGRAKMAIPKP